jgi:hypothetical protein
MKKIKSIGAMGGSGKHIAAFRERGMAAQKAGDDAIPQKTLEHLSALSLHMVRAGEAAINFRRAIETSPLSKKARRKLWRDFIDRLPR